MSSRHDPDLLIATWVAESAGAGAPDYLSEVLTVVERTSQHRWARWVPGAGVSSPNRAPLVRSRALLIAAVALLVLLLGAALAAGAFRKPPFTLQQAITLPEATGVMFVSAAEDGIWASAGDHVFHVDPSTGATTTLTVPNVGTNGLTGVIEHDGAVWVSDYDGNAVVRIDPATGAELGRTTVGRPGHIAYQDGLWIQGSGAGIERIDPATMTVVKQFPDALAFDVVPGTLWYLAATNGGAEAVEIDPATFAERQRIAVPARAAKAITIAPDGNPWVWSRRMDGTSVAVVNANTHAVGTPYDLPYDAIGGINAIAGSMWALPAANTPYGSQLQELGPAGPTGRVAALDEGLDPDGAVVGFGSIWIPWEGQGKLYRYPVDPLAP